MTIAEKHVGDGFQLLRADEIAPEDVRWEWEGRIASGKLSIVEGDPGVGKSMLTDDMAARVSTGAPFPDQPGVVRPPGGVIMLGGEDDLADTVVPRLIAHAADLKQIRLLKPVYRENGVSKLVSIGRDIDRLAQAIDSMLGCRLVVIDPLTAFLGKTDSYKDAEVRAVLTPLSELASRKRVAMVVVVHLNKQASTKAAYRTGGSIAFSAAARTIWLVCRRKDYHTRLFIQKKTNVGPDDVGGLEFTIHQNANGKPVIDWKPERVNISVADALAEEAHQSPEQLPRDRAKNFLAMALRNGPRPVGELRAEAKQQGIDSESTLNRAREDMGIVRSRAKKTNRVFWRLPKAKQKSA